MIFFPINLSSKKSVDQFPVNKNQLTDSFTNCLLVVVLLIYICGDFSCFPVTSSSNGLPLSDSDIMHVCAEGSSGLLVCDLQPPDGVVSLPKKKPKPPYTAAQIDCVASSLPRANRPVERS